MLMLACAAVTPRTVISTTPYQKSLVASCLLRLVVLVLVTAMGPTIEQETEQMHNQ